VVGFVLSGGKIDVSPAVINVIISHTWG